MRGQDKPIQESGPMLQAYYANRQRLINIAYSYVKDFGVAEDIVHDAITKILEMTKDTEIRNPKAYLITAVRNRSLNFLSSSSKKYTIPVDNFVLLNVSSDEPSQQTELEDREKLRVFMSALETLPPQCRRVLLLKKVEGMSLKEVAQKLNISVSTVQKHLTKGLTRCTIYLAENGYG